MVFSFKLNSNHIHGRADLASPQVRAWRQGCLPRIRAEQGTMAKMLYSTEVDSAYPAPRGGRPAVHHGMEDIVQIPVPLPHIRSVSTWLLRGDPLTLVDTGPHADDALVALEAGLRRAGARLEDVELVLLTHHHLDHTGLAATIAARSGAAVAALDRAADYGERYAERSEA